MYIQDKIEENGDEIFEKLDKGAHLYVCGLKGMMPPIQEVLKGIAAKKGLDYDKWLKAEGPKGQETVARGSLLIV